jgi:hypothetical protein
MNINWTINGYSIPARGSEWVGGLRKIGDVSLPCIHPEHNPPSNIVLQPGIYEYTCPGCGHTVKFTVNGFTC